MREPDHIRGGLNWLIENVPMDLLLMAGWTSDLVLDEPTLRAVAGGRGTIVRSSLARLATLRHYLETLTFFVPSSQFGAWLCEHLAELKHLSHRGSIEDFEAGLHELTRPYMGHQVRADQR
jgi:hypothetical protein